MTELKSNNIFDVQVDNEAATTLLDSAKWTRFIAIIYFVFFALATLAMLFVFASQQGDLQRMLGEQEINATLLLAILIPAFAIMFYLGYLLNRFAIFTRKAIHSQDPELLGKGIAAMKNYFLIYAIFAIIGIIFTVISLIFGIPV